MIFAFAHLVLLALVGYGVMRVWIQPTSLMERLAFAPVVGLTMSLLASLLLALSPVPLFYAVPYATVLLAIVALIVWSGRDRPYPGKMDLLGLAALVATIFVLALLQDRLNLVIMTYDSHRFIGNATEVVLNGGAMLSHDFSWAASFPVPIALGHGVAQFWGEDIHPLLTIFTGFALMLLMGAALRPRRIMSVRSWAAPGLVLLAFATTGFFIYFSFYIHSSLMTALVMLAAVLTLIKATEILSRRWLFLAVPFLILLGLTRLEAPILSAVVFGYALCCYPGEKTFTLREEISAGGAVALPLIVWLALMLGKGTDQSIVNDSQLLIQIALLAAMPLVPLLLRIVRRRSALVPLLPLAGTAALALLVLLFFVLKPGHMLASVSNLFANTLGPYGLWTYSWAGVLVVCALSVLLGARISRKTILVGSVAATTMLFIVALAFFRDESIPYRLGFGDSGNRMLLHALPLAWLCAGYLIANLQTPVKKKARRPVRGVAH